MPRRLIEEAFPLEKVSEDSKHEKRPRAGHIASLHVWPARRPLAACRAVAIATLLPDPADAPDPMKAEYERLSGSAIPEDQRRYLCNDLISDLTRWGDENGHGDWDAKDQKGRWINKLRIVRELIAMAHDGKPPKVLDMFAGGGAIPLEAMRLGCEVTANDYNPVAWFILKCTLEYSQRLAGKTFPLPDLTPTAEKEIEPRAGDLADHVQVWGRWVLERARAELADCYPVIDGKPPIAYLWARTVPCQDAGCGATVPLIKTLWICKKPEKILKDTPENRKHPNFLRIKKDRNRTKVVINALRVLKLCTDDTETKRVRFEVIAPDDKTDIGEPTMSGSSATCPFCGGPQPNSYIKRCGQERKLKTQLMAVVYKEEEYGKEYRPPTEAEIRAAEIPEAALEGVAAEIPDGMPYEELPESGRTGAGRAFTSVPYGFKEWSHLFTNRQLLVLMTFLKWTRAGRQEIENAGYPPAWTEAINGYLVCVFDRLLDYTSSLVLWDSASENIRNVFTTYTLPMTWDFSEGAILADGRGSYHICLEKILLCVDYLTGGTPPFSLGDFLALGSNSHVSLQRL